MYTKLKNRLLALVLSIVLAMGMSTCLSFAEDNGSNSVDTNNIEVVDSDDSEVLEGESESLLQNGDFGEKDQIDDRTSGLYHDGIHENYFELPFDEWFYVKNWEKKINGNYYDGYYNKTPFDNQFFSFTAKATGWVDVTVEPVTYEFGDGEYTVALLDYWKDRISYSYYLGDDLPNYTLTFGVKKGEDYYVRVGVDYCPDNYKIKIVNESYRGTYGTTKKKAKTIKRWKRKYGTFVAGSGNKVKWYKIKLKKSQRLRFRFNRYYADEYYSNYGIFGKIYNSSGKNRSGAVNSGKKLPAGTYYLKVYKKGSKCSGVFDFKWH